MYIYICIQNSQFNLFTMTHMPTVDEPTVQSATLYIYIILMTAKQGEGIDPIAPWVLDHTQNISMQ